MPYLKDLLGGYQMMHNSNLLDNYTVYMPFEEHNSILSDYCLTLFYLTGIDALEGQWEDYE